MFEVKSDVDEGGLLECDPFWRREGKFAQKRPVSQ